MTDKKPKKKYEHAPRPEYRSYQKNDPDKFRVKPFRSLFDLWPVK